ncbi:MAG: amidohydrolase family protein, partial [Syntrophales bacterium LBB04]|nr:amidohydrolase family protein [Syntrophales bacterium LBB04]
ERKETLEGVRGGAPASEGMVESWHTDFNCIAEDRGGRVGEVTNTKDGGLLIKGGIVVTMDPQRRIFRNGAILVKGDTIEAVGTSEEMEARYGDASFFDATNRLILPGFIDTHVHLSEHIVRSLIPDNEPDWMARWLMPVYASLSPEDEYTSAMLAFIEMAKTGTTTFCEAGTCINPEAALQALQRVGLRGILGRWTWDLPPAPERMKQTTDQALKANEDFIVSVRRVADNKIMAWPLVLGMGTASERLMREAKALADYLGLGMGMMHASSIPSLETRETIQSLRRFEEWGLMGKNLKLTHMVYADDDDIDLLKKHEVKISHCPTAAMKHCKGLTRYGKFPEMDERGVCVSLGADSANGSDHVNMLRIMNLTALLYKDVHMDPSVFTAERVLEMATIRGAEALLLDKQIGSIEPGKKADLVLFDRDHPELRPLLNIPGSLVYSVSETSITTVFVGGKIILDNGKISHLDEHEVYANADQLSLKLLERAKVPLPSRWPLI